MPNVKILPDFILKDIDDPWVRENFFRLQKFLQRMPILLGDFTFQSYEFTQAYTNRRIAHGLGYKPLDIISTAVTGPGTVTWNYELFDTKYLDVTTTGPCVFRGFIGAYREGAL